MPSMPTICAASLICIFSCKFDSILFGGTHVYQEKKKQILALLADESTSKITNSCGNQAPEQSDIICLNPARFYQFFPRLPPMAVSPSPSLHPLSQFFTLSEIEPRNIFRSLGKGLSLSLSLSFSPLLGLGLIYGLSPCAAGMGNWVR